ncbi:helix-turn-helix domain-containing protein [Halorientalis halophila]|uniref:helix-turn-helix domain-containing protein n=1 Tax=Halorientalis halophila TaxID=3108499 RepID=UPI00300AB9E6
MSDPGLQISMAIDAPAGCPAGEASTATGTAVESVTWNAATDGPVTEEFTADADLDRDGVEPVFETDGRTRYRFERDWDEACACEMVELEGCPLEEVRAEDGRLHLRFYAPDVDRVREIVADLRERYGGVRLKHLSQSGEVEEQNLVLVDRNRLTDRQREVLETAYEMGYFEHPRESNASDVADTLDVSLSTFTEHLAIAQSKVLDAVVETD